MGKLNNVREALEIARGSHDPGCERDHARVPGDPAHEHLESVLTYEGTSEIHTLILGEALTGLRAYE